VGSKEIGFMKISREKAIELNKREYGEIYGLFKWVTPGEAERASRERDGILQSMQGKVSLGFNGTKVYLGELSPGCRLCGAGSWSCLFINGICNAKCFFCPTEQASRSEPTTSGIPFVRVRDYMDYLQKFDIRGVSISGGEPFMTFDRTWLFVSKIKRRLGKDVYIWLYTNGIAVTREKLERLKDAGLDEIRFDISADHYKMDKVRSAVKVMDTATVEIPSIPEEYERLKIVLGDLEGIGVKFLNLHHLRCTPYNCNNLIARGYTFLHGAKVTILESELTALKLIAHAQEKGIVLPINYCSFVYKDKYQTLGHRRRLARYVHNTFETISPAGAIKRISIKGEPREINQLVDGFEHHGLDRSLWRVEGGGRTLLVHEGLVPYIPMGQHALYLSYYLPVLMPGPSYQFPFMEIALNQKKKLVIERRPLFKERAIGQDELLENLDEGRSSPRPAERRPSLCPEEIRYLEEIGCGLQEYF
jgi:pyruvate formate-lyase activating enzyme-like uncharacterized protein